MRPWLSFWLTIKKCCYVVTLPKRDELWLRGIRKDWKSDISIIPIFLFLFCLTSFCNIILLTHHDGIIVLCNSSNETHKKKCKAKSIKTGGLRLFLTLYLMGQQNSPEKGSWRANQSGDSTIDLYYCDQSGALMMNFKEDKITIDRLGSAPSTKYLMHESEMLNGLLDELQSIVDGGDVNEVDRLLVLPEPGDAIDRARDTIAFS